MISTNKNTSLYFFEELSKIPRESGHEQAISNWLSQWANDLGLDVTQDAHFNLLVKKKAAKGYEHCESVLLQAHMDMVCEKTAASPHDFAKDPIQLTRDGDWIVSSDGTSIGADNGIGVATAMAILADTELKHPGIEVAFTVDEESSFLGAETISADLFESKRMINLDHADDREIIAGSCGGTGINFNLPIDYENSFYRKAPVYNVKVCGLKGGHSGEDIHRGRGNAIELLFRLLDESKVRLCQLSGGTNRLAIPREAEAIILVMDEAFFENRVFDMKKVFRKEFGESGSEIDILFEKIKVYSKIEKDNESAKSETNDVLTNCEDAEISDKIFPLKESSFLLAKQIVQLFPNGIVKMSSSFEGVVESSINLGIIDIFDGKLSIVAEARGQFQSNVDEIKSKILALQKLCGADVEFFNEYTPWEYKENSSLREKALTIYKELFNEDMEVLIVHAGLECGFFAEKVPEMDIISLGPNCQFFHSPNERVSISSIEKFYWFLITLLAELG
ncbi:MAG: beta-Ala-His dipeptidase [Anaerovoracaceae bacterium]